MADFGFVLPDRLKSILDHHQQHQRKSESFEHRLEKAKLKRQVRRIHTSPRFFLYSYARTLFQPGRGLSASKNTNNTCAYLSAFFRLFLNGRCKKRRPCPRLLDEGRSPIVYQSRRIFLRELVVFA